MIQNSTHNTQNDFNSETSIVRSTLNSINENKLLDLTHSQIDDIVNFIFNNVEKWREESKNKQSPIKIKADIINKLPRSLQYNSVTEVYLLFNKVKHGDRIVGKGQFKKIKSAINLLTGEIVSRATQTFTNYNEKSNIKKEIKKCLKFSGQKGIAYTFQTSILKIKDLNKTTYMQRLYQFDLSKAGKHLLCINNKLIIAKHIFQAITYIHQQKVIHKDIKPENIFLEFDIKTSITIDAVLGDFGFSINTDDQQELSKSYGKGTPLYASPEYAQAVTQKNIFLLKKANSFPYDNWTLGVVFYQLFRDEVPEWKNLPAKPVWFVMKLETIQGLFEYLAKLKKDWLPKPKEQTIGSIIYELLEIDPEKRLTAAEALKKFNEFYPNID